MRYRGSSGKGPCFGAQALSLIPPPCCGTGAARFQEILCEEAPPATVLEKGHVLARILMRAKT